MSGPAPICPPSSEHRRGKILLSPLYSFRPSLRQRILRVLPADPEPVEPRKELLRGQASMPRASDSATAASMRFRMNTRIAIVAS
jgi:hypothetical protein